MPLDPQAKAFIDTLPVGGDVDYDALPAELIRKGWEAIATHPTGETVATVLDRTIPGPEGAIGVRIYTPDAAAPLPLLVYLHGGGFVTGSLDTHDPLCRALANRAACTVLSVDYRLAPEHRFPAALDDSHAALRWAADHAAELGVDAERIAVGGDSAGGNLAAATALRCRERGPRLCHQLLIYPVIAPDFETASYRENAEGYLLTRGMMMWFWRQYLADPAQGNDPEAAPLRAPDHAGLAPATVITAEFDPLRDEGEAYAARLREAGVPTELLRYDGQIHAFVSFADRFDRGREAIDRAAQNLRVAFAA